MNTHTLIEAMKAMLSQADEVHRYSSWQGMLDDTGYPDERERVRSIIREYELTNGAAGDKGEAGKGEVEMQYPPYANRTPVCMIINELNHQCVEAGKKSEFEKAHEIAVLCGTVEVAIAKAGYDREYDDPKENEATELLVEIADSGYLKEKHTHNETHLEQRVDRFLKTPMLRVRNASSLPNTPFASHAVGDRVKFISGLIGATHRPEHEGTITAIDRRGMATVVCDDGSEWQRDLCALRKVQNGDLSNGGKAHE